MTHNILYLTADELDVISGDNDTNKYQQYVYRNGRKRGPSTIEKHDHLHVQYDNGQPIVAQELLVIYVTVLSAVIIRPTSIL